MPQRKPTIVVKKADGRTSKLDPISERLEKLFEPFVKTFVGRVRVRAIEIGCLEGRTSLWFINHILTHSTSKL
jgi:hypothetical protein